MTSLFAEAIERQVTFGIGVVQYHSWQEPGFAILGVNKELDLPKH